MDKQAFYKLMQTVANGWNTKNPKKAANCFTKDAVYIEPPDKQLYIGRQEIFLLSGGEKPKEMEMTWHNLFFNEKTQTGAGEYTFKMGEYSHGVVIVELEKKKIKLWREYQWDGNLSRKEFLSTKNKKFKWTGKNI